MELDDSFTEKLVQRTQARKEYIRKKKALDGQNTGVKRSALVEEQCSDNDYDTANKSFEESPKRQCLEAPTVDSSDSDSDDKENSYSQEKVPDNFVPVQSVGPVKGLAALKKKNDGHSAAGSVVNDNRMESQVNKQRTYMYSTNTSDLFGDRKSRFAHLAADINQWEDDSYKPSQMPNKVTLSANALKSAKPSGLHGSHSTYTTATDNLCSKSSASNTDFANASSKHVTFEDGGNYAKGFFSAGVVGSVASCLPSSSLKGNNCNKVKSQRQAKDRDVWDEAIMAALETSMLVKSPAKYISEVPEVNKIQFNNDQNDIEMKDSEDSMEEMKKESCTQEIADPILEEKNCRLSRIQLDKKPVFPAPNASSSSPPQNHSTDPAQLSLSARKALFERAFFGESSKTSDSVIEPKMSVAQRAAMFEKASNKNQSPKKRPVVGSNRFSTSASSPVKFVTPDPVVVNSPVKASYASPVQKPKCSAVPVDVKGSPAKHLSSVELTPSPSKSVGSHTRLVQQQLFENANSNWQQNEKVAKDVEQRKTELSSLVNRWEKMSSSSNSESTSNSDVAQSCRKSENEDFEPVFQENHPIKYDDIVSEEDDSNDEGKFERNISGVDISAKEADDVQLNYDSLSGISDDAAAVCDNMDELLDDALVDQPKMLENVFEANHSFPKTSKSASCSSYPFTVPNATASVTTPKLTNMSESDANLEVPLLYTISFYRKTKKEARTPPVQTIVRRERVMSPPSPEVDKTAQIQEKLQGLNEEILMQQTVISQTSQALNLCHATAEFSGSTEQVEGERLLLIATQKRQACLTEVQRLKTQGSQNEYIEDGTGTLTISDLQLPLKRQFMQSELQCKSNDVHYFLCLFRHGPQVIVSQMLSTNDTVTDGALCFTNHIKIQNLPADFSVVFEVYALQTKKDSVPHEKKYRIKREHSKISFTPKGKKSEKRILMPAISSPGGPNAVRTPSFGVVGYTRFTIHNFGKKVFTLDKVPFESPLDGVLKAKLRLHAEHRVVEKGFLTMFEDVSGFGAWHRRWCVLDGHSVSFWKYPDDEKRKDPIGVIDLKQCVTGVVRLVSHDVCSRLHTFEVVTIRPQAKGDRDTLVSRSADTITTTKYLLSADTKEERILWCNKLNEALTNLRKWNPQAVRPLDVKYKK